MDVNRAGLGDIADISINFLSFIFYVITFFLFMFIATNCVSLLCTLSDKSLHMYNKKVILKLLISTTGVHIIV